MAKRTFERGRGVLTDRYEDPPGQKCDYHLPATMLDEALILEERTAQLEGVAQGRGSYALIEDGSPALLDALLRGHQAGSTDAMSLLKFLDDQRVRPAILEAARRAPAERIANQAQVVGLAGGVGARELLWDRLREIEADPRTFQDDPFCNLMAGSLQSVAVALLRLDPDATEAADALLRLFRHPCALNRDTAVSQAAEVLRGEMQTEAMRRIRQRFESLLGTDNPRLFLRAAGAVNKLQIDVGNVLERCRVLLDHEAPDIRAATAHLLVALGAPAAYALVLEWLPRASSLRTAVSIAVQLGRLVPADRRVDVAQRGLADESPSLRLEAAGLLDTLDRATARKLAGEAIADEPDASLKLFVERRWGGADPGG